METDSKQSNSIYIIRGDVVRFDIEFCNKTIETFFIKYGGQEAILRSVHTALKLIHANHPGATKEQIIEAKKVIGHIKDTERSDEEEIASYSIKNFQFIPLLLNVIKETENFLVAQRIQLQTLIDDRSPLYYKINVSEDFKKSKITVISENALSKDFRVTVQNLYQTYCKIFSF